MQGFIFINLYLFVDSCTHAKTNISFAKKYKDIKKWLQRKEKLCEEYSKKSCELKVGLLRGYINRIGITANEMVKSYYYFPFLKLIQWYCDFIPNITRQLIILTLHSLYNLCTP